VLWRVAVHSCNSAAYACYSECVVGGSTCSQMRASSTPTLPCMFGLAGVVDFYPATSGKEGAAHHLMSRWGVGPAATAFLCDDDNDLALAAVVGRAFLPSISAVSVLSGVGGGNAVCGATAIMVQAVCLAPGSAQYRTVFALLD
jgi:hypothetical protein